MDDSACNMGCYPIHRGCAAALRYLWDGMSGAYVSRETNVTDEHQWMDITTLYDRARGQARTICGVCNEVHVKPLTCDNAD